MPEKNGQSDPSSPNDLDTLESKLAAAQARRNAKVKPDKRDDNSLLGMAWRLSTELLVSVLVGMFLGLGIDTLLGTKPWGFFLGLGFGIAAGFMSVFRTANAMNAKTAHLPIGDKVTKADDDD
jgi:ATP synthase protein I